MLLFFACSGISVYRVGDRLLNGLLTTVYILFGTLRLSEAVGAGASFPPALDTAVDVISLLLIGCLFAHAMKLLIHTYQERHEVMLGNLAYGTSHRVGEDFLSGLVESIVQTPRIRIAIISESASELRANRIISGASTAQDQPPQCLSPGESVTWSDEFLTECAPGLKSLTILLTDRDGDIVGHLVLFHEAGEISARQYSSLQIFASRASAEIQRIRADRKSEEMEARMRHVQKLESLGLLAGGIAHDFNNLLQAIQGYTTLANDSLPPDSRSHAAISRIDQVVSKGAAMCDRLLAYAGRSVRREIVCDLNQLLTEAADIVRSGRPGCVVTVERSEQPLRVWGDAAQLSQVLINLLTNAADAVEGGSGEIYASTHIGRASKTIGDGLRLDDTQEYAFIQVSDNGCGIADDTKSKLFDPFFTTKGDGRGIGLAAVSGIVRSHQGDITFTSKLGTGTTFVVAIPLTQEPLEIVDSDHEAPESAPGLRVLAVDDDELVLNTTQLLLESANIDVTTASSGQNALDVIEQSGDSFHVVLLDQTMPGMSGLETCEECEHVECVLRLY